MALSGVISQILDAYAAVQASLPGPLQNFLNLFLLVLLIVVYSVFIWKFYRFIAKKNIFQLNLNQYNKAGHPFSTKLVASAFYLLEYVIILPFLIFFWFAVFTIFLMLLTNDLSINAILLISVTIIAAVRMTSYIPHYGEDLAKEIAKLLPFTLLAVAISGSKTFNFETVIGHLAEIPALTGTILNYLVFIIILEVVLRGFEFVFSLLGFYDENEDQGKKKEEKS